MQETKTHDTGNLIGAKVYFDGSQWIAIPHTERPYRKRRRARDKPNENETVLEFEQAFKQAKGKRQKRKESLIKEFTPLFENTEQASEFVEEHFNRLSRNRWERYKRMIRRAYLQPWDYFATFTFDSEKHTEESFRKQLMNCLYHLSNRKGWRYIGVWERGELGKRLHFHALMYIPQGTMVGELEEHNDYSTKRHKWEKSVQNSFFNERFGRSDFDAIVCSKSVSDSVNYMLKYLTKSDEKVVYSRGLKTYLVADILDEDILCPYHLDDEYETKYLYWLSEFAARMAAISSIFILLGLIIGQISISGDRIYLEGVNYNIAIPIIYSIVMAGLCIAVCRLLKYSQKRQEILKDIRTKQEMEAAVGATASAGTEATPAPMIQAAPAADNPVAPVEPLAAAPTPAPMPVNAGAAYHAPVTDTAKQAVLARFQKALSPSGMTTFTKYLDTLTADQYQRLMQMPIKKKVTTILLAIFLGGIGIDRFYVGDVKLGVLKIVGSVVASLLILVPILGTIASIANGIWKFVDIFISHKKIYDKNYENAMGILGKA